MKKKNGFISMALVYSFLILYLFLMTAIINSYLEKNKYLETIDDKINLDIELYKKNKKSLYTKILEDNVPYQASTLNLSETSSATNGQGLFYIIENDIRTYFYRGDIQNNFLLFGKEYVGNKEHQICWRIIRSDDMGGIRLIYSGLYNESTNKCPDYGNIGLSKYNNETNDNAYIGFTYGAPNKDSYIETHSKFNNEITNSTIMENLNKWYGERTNLNIENNYNLIKNGKFCNDKDIYIPEENKNNQYYENNYGYNDVNTTYNPKNRVDKCTPTFSCELKHNEFNYSVNSTLYSLLAPVGLITVDEVMYAGGVKNNINDNYYLYSNYNYWTMSPAKFEHTVEYGGFLGLDRNDYYNAYVYCVGDSGEIVEKTANENNIYVRPVISINSSVLVTKGNGYNNNPYIIE